MECNFEDFVRTVYKEYHKLEDVKDYLNEAGIARLYTFRYVIWYLEFVSSFEELAAWDEFNNLINIGGKHEEYYKIVRQVYEIVQSNIRKES